MALPLSTITTEVGKELTNCDGTPAAEIEVSFDLVSEGGGSLIVVDTVSGNPIIPKRLTFITTVLGGLTAEVWPTVRGDKLCYYQVSVQNGPSFRAPLPDADITWEAFVAGRITV